MKCEVCGDETVERKATNNAPYRYLLSGLKNIYLVGINVMECPSCSEEYPVIPKMEELHNLIANDLINKSTKLKGDEIRFLRKNAGFSSIEFATLLKIDPSSLSRVEAGKDKIGPTLDKLARMLGATAFKENEKLRKLLLEQVEKIMNAKPTFQLDGRNWKALKAD